MVSREPLVVGRWSLVIGRRSSVVGYRLSAKAEELAQDNVHATQLTLMRRMVYAQIPRRKTRRGMTAILELRNSAPSRA
jgi:hypothetical protein